MLLQGSCHCQEITFSLESPHPYPFNLCYCSICRKTSGSGGYGINLSGRYETLQVQGREFVTVYQVAILDEKTGAKTLSPAQRSFCSKCGSSLSMATSDRLT